MWAIAGSERSACQVRGALSEIDSDVTAEDGDTVAGEVAGLREASQTATVAQAELQARYDEALAEMERLRCENEQLTSEQQDVAALRQEIGALKAASAAQVSGGRLREEETDTAATMATHANGHGEIRYDGELGRELVSARERIACLEAALSADADARARIDAERAHVENNDAGHTLAASLEGVVAADAQMARVTVQNTEVAALEAENGVLKAEISALRAANEMLQSADGEERKGDEGGREVDGSGSELRRHCDMAKQLCGASMEKGNDEHQRSAVPTTTNPFDDPPDADMW